MTIVSLAMCTATSQLGGQADSQRLETGQKITRKRHGWIWSYAQIEEKSKFKGRVKSSVISQIPRLVCPKSTSVVTTDPYTSSTTAPPNNRNIVSICLLLPNSPPVSLPQVSIACIPHPSLPAKSIFSDAAQLIFGFHL